MIKTIIQTAMESMSALIIDYIRGGKIRLMLMQSDGHACPICLDQVHEDMHKWFYFLLVWVFTNILWTTVDGLACVQASGCDVMQYQYQQ